MSSPASSAIGPGCNAVGQIEVHLFVEDAGRHAERDQVLHAARPVAGLFGQLAQGGLGGVLVRFEGAGRQFDQGLPHGHAIIPHEADAAVVQQRQNHHRAGMPHDFADVAAPVGHRLHGPLHAETLPLEENVRVVHGVNVTSAGTPGKGPHRRHNRSNRPTRSGDRRKSPSPLPPVLSDATPMT